MTKVRIYDMRMNDGSRHFGSLPETYDVRQPQWHALRQWVASLEGARLTGFVTDDVTEAWIDFELAGHRFSMNNQHGDWWFFVEDPSCPDELVEKVLDHFEELLAPRPGPAPEATPHGSFRAVVYEADARVTRRDFATLEEARRCADDAASETENGIVTSHVLDDGGQRVHTGRHYAAARRAPGSS